MMSSLVSWWFSVVIKKRHQFHVTTETSATPRGTDMMSSLVSLWLCAVIRITISLLRFKLLAEVGDSSATFKLSGRSGPLLMQSIRSVQKNKKRYNKCWESIKKYRIWTSRPHLPLEETEEVTQDRELDFRYCFGNGICR